MTTNTLKIIALVLMFIDHTGEFIPGMPIFLRWLGRLSAPIFIYCMVWGFHFTHDRKKYLVRMYLFSLIMGLTDTFLNLAVKDSYHYCTNNIFTTLLLICIFIGLWDRQKKHPSSRLIFKFLLFQALTLALTFIFNKIFVNSEFINLFIALFPNVLTCEGGIVVFILGVGLYYNKESKRETALFYLIFCAIYLAVSIYANTPAAASNVYPMAEYLFNYNYQWMMVAALPFFLMYNGQKGRSMKYLFYVFYPVHIAVLFLIGNFMF